MEKAILSGRNEIIKSKIEKARRGSRVYIMGMSDDGYSSDVEKILDIDGYIDDFYGEPFFKGYPVKRRFEVCKSSLIIVCSTVKARTACKSLLEDGFKNVVDYPTFYVNQEAKVREGLRLRIIADFFEEYKENKWKFDFYFKKLNDEKSRMVWRNLIEYRLTANINLMSPFLYRPTEQYFSSVVELGDDEIFADIGGFDGQTTIEFIKRCPGYSRIHFFEPESQNFALAEKKLENYPGVFFYKKGLSDKNQRLTFSSERGAASAVSEAGNVSIEVDRLDELVTEKLTFIKMDIEGAESFAIEGSKKHILEDRPKMAIAVYHKADDFWKIPEQILNIREDYDLYLRHYTEGTDETIMYFIPREI